MASPNCPRCGADHELEHLEPLSRCAWCGALLAVGEWPEQARVARPRIHPSEARSAVAKALGRRGATWLPGPPQLIYYPFALSDEPRQPYLPLAALPPLVRQQWLPSGAPLFGEATHERTQDRIGESAVRVPISFPTPKTAALVHYPFYRIPLGGHGGLSAAWCDGTSGQIMLPENLVPPRSTTAGPTGRPLTHWIWGSAAAGLLCALALPANWAAVGCATLAVGIWWKAGTR